MKATSIIFLIAAILVLAFIILQAFVSRSTNKTETVEYKVLQSYDEFEIRSYPNVNYSSVSMVKQSYKDVSGSGFRVLAGYIFGGNEENKSIAMTTPVAMEMGDTMRMKFIIPKEYEISDLPKPNDQNIQFESESEKIIAAITFGGWADDEKLAKKQQELTALLAEKGIEHTGKFVFLGYNPPYQMTNRRNEMTVELINYNG
jgi:hypothetical protein